MKNIILFKKKKSSTIAKDRLKILLISDRIDCSAHTLDMIKQELIHTISKYISIDEEHVEINYKRSIRGKNKKTSLYANIPICNYSETNDIFKK